MGDERITDERLHRFFDGELSPSEAAAVQRRVEAEPELRAKLEGLGELRELVRASVEDSMGEVPTDDLWARIQAGTGGEAREVRSKPALRSISGGAIAGGEVAPEKSERGAPRREPSPNLSSPIDLGARRRRITTIVIGGLALAAAVLLLVLRPGEPREGGMPQPIASHDEAAPAPPIVPATGEETAEDVVSRTEVLEVDFGANTGAIFSVEGDDGQRYAVVWLDDEQARPTAAE